MTKEHDDLEKRNGIEALNDLLASGLSAIQLHRRHLRDKGQLFEHISKILHRLNEMQHGIYLIIEHGKFNTDKHKKPKDR